MSELDPNLPFATLKQVFNQNMNHWHIVAAGMNGVSEETTTGIHCLFQLEKKNRFHFPAINVNDTVTKSNFKHIQSSQMATLSSFSLMTAILALAALQVTHLSLCQCHSQTRHSLSSTSTKRGES